MERTKEVERLLISGGMFAPNTVMFFHGPRRRAGGSKLTIEATECKKQKKNEEIEDYFVRAHRWTAKHQ